MNVQIVGTRNAEGNLSGDASGLRLPFAWRGPDLLKDPALQTISINLPRELVRRVQTLGFNQELSASSITEYALLGFLSDHTEAELADRLRGLGATLRRPDSSYGALPDE